MRHIPVLLQEVIDSLELRPGMNVIDCTLGDAGHAERILERTAPNGKLLGIDVDPESLLRAKQYLYAFGNRVIFERNNFENIQQIAKTLQFRPVQGILMDFGWSSPQFEERGRGFSFQKSAEPLDMRYDPLLKCEHVGGEPALTVDGRPLYGRCTAAEMLNRKSEQELEQIFRVYGEEHLSEEIAHSIVQIRESDPFETVGELVGVVLSVYRAKLKTDKEIPWVGGLHPATKIFQALRIAVNDELGVIERVLPQAINVLESSGRLAVITFHSLEDRVVKHYFKSEQGKSLHIITKKPIVCSEEEYASNPRARSAKLRVIEKI